jgi:glucose/arabinose dehydrogenase
LGGNSRSWEERVKKIKSWPLIWTVLLGCVVWLALNVEPALASVVPPNFDDTFVTEIDGPTALAFTPDGRMLATSQFGTLHVYKDGAQLPAPALDLTAKVCSNKERGLLGVAVDPSFTSNHYIYLYYTFNKLGTCEYNTANSPVNRVSRFILPDDNVVSPSSEFVLIDNIPSPDGIHNAGDLHFGKDGYLYISVGEGGCDYAGDSGCGRLNDASRDLNVLLGKILRITADGSIPPTNPFVGAGTARCNLAGRTDVGKKCQETYSWGLRNPFRISFDPNAAGTRFFINDVGHNTWEEIDLGQAGADFGWNVREGPCATGSTTDCDLPPNSGMTNPIYSYPHSSGCSAVTAGAFVPNGLWTPDFDGTYLYGDFVCGKIIRLTPVTGGGFTATDFVTGLGASSISGMIFGPSGSTQALYYLNYPTREVRRITFTGTANRAPRAVATADVTSGPTPLTVHFDGSASSDPDLDPLTYDWDFGDGSAHSNSATPSHTYTADGNFTATLLVSDGRGGQNRATVSIDAGNTAPVPVIESPTPTKRFAVGEEVRLRGSATDARDGTLPASSLSWTVIKHHNTHIHPFLPPTSGNDIPIVGPDPEDIAATTTTYLEIQLTATDAQGLSRTVTQDLRPNLVDVNFATNPTGLQLKVNGSLITSPTTIVSWEAWRLSVSATDQNDQSGRPMAFAGWWDGGGAARTIVTPSSQATYTAAFRPLASFVFSDGFESGDLSAWTSITGLSVQQQERYTGAWAARQTSTSAATYAYKRLAADENELYYRLRFKVLSQGNNNVTLGKFSTATGASILAFYRSATGTLALRNDTSGITTSSATVATSGTWHELLLRLRVGSAGQTDVWLDGVPISDLKTSQSLGSVPIGRIQVGNNQTGRSYDMALDDVGVSRPITAYARPKGSSPISLPLVPAFKPCSSPNAAHGAPLSQSSCSPPNQASDYLTVGTPEVNGHSADSVGRVLLKVVGESPISHINGDQADVELTAHLTDIRNKSDSSDYGGELQVVTTIRITDRYNGPYLDEPATVSDLPLSFTMRCAADGDPTVGATCDAATTADALSAGTVKEDRRSIWKLGQIQVFDGGSDGFASTGGNTLFATQGAFAP